MEAQIKIELAKLQAQGKIAPIGSGVMESSSVVWQRKKVGSCQLCADLNVHVNGKIMTERPGVHHY